ncbi:DUF5309 family protein, partial [Actinomadura adrarensis]
DAVTVRALTGGAVGVLKPDDIYYVIGATTDTYQLARKPGGAAIAFATDGGATTYGLAPVTEDMVQTLLQDVWESGGIQVSETATVMVGGTLKRSLTEIFITRKNYQEQTRNVGGVSVMTIETDFGRLNVMLNRHMPTSVLQVVSLDECAPAFLPIPGKGFLFTEPISKVGAADRFQLYGEIGLRYGNEKAHGNIKGLHMVASDETP